MSEFRRRLMVQSSGGAAPQYAVTKATNAPVMAICYAQGWAANENYMTFEEAAAVTDIRNVFDYQYLSFAEFQYFTGVTSVSANSLRRLTSLVLPPNLRNIGNNAFLGGTFTEVAIPENVTIPSTGANRVFTGCNNLTKIIWRSNDYPGINFISDSSIPSIESDNPLYYSNDGCIWSADKTKLYIASTKNRTSFSFIGTETEIGDAFCSFNNNTYTLKIPSTVISFNLRRDVNFQNCVLKVLDMSECNVTNKPPRIVGGTFDTVKMPQCSSIGNMVIFQTNITNFIFSQITPPTLSALSFYGSTFANIYVPDSAVNDYKTANNWTNYASIIKPLSEFVE